MLSGTTFNFKLLYCVRLALLLFITNSLSAQQVDSFTLINSDTDTDILEIADGQQIDLSSIQGFNINIRANTTPAITGSVMMELTGTQTNSMLENVAPYALFGDVNGDYLGMTIGLGNYTISATAYSDSGLEGTVLGNLSASFSITSQGTTKIGISEIPTDLSIDELTQKPSARNLQIVPNPACDSAVLILTAQDLRISEVTIFTMDGSYVRRHTQRDLGLDQNRKIFQVSDLENGVYLIVVKTNSSKVFQTKLVVPKHQKKGRERL